MEKPTKNWAKNVNVQLTEDREIVNNHMKK